MAEENGNINPVSFFAMNHNENVEFVEKKNKDYVLFGKDNLFPDQIKELSLKSTYHSSILKTKADMIGGQGILNETNDAKIDTFIENQNGELDLESIIHKLSQDLVTFNAFALFITWSRDGTQVAQIDYIDVAEVRVGKKKDENGNRTFYWSPDWSNVRKEENKPVAYQEFNPEYTKEKEQILYIKEPSIYNSKFYTLPEYYSAWNYIELESKISEFKKNYISNGFWAGAHIDVKANPSPEQKDEIVKEIKKQSQGEGNAGRMLVTFSQDESTRTEFKPIEMQFPDDFFEQTHSEIQQAILGVHHVTNPQLLGIKVSGELGGSDDLTRDINVFYRLAIKPKEKILERVLNNLFEASFDKIENQVIELERYDDFRFDEQEEDNNDEESNED